MPLTRSPAPANPFIAAAASVKAEPPPAAVPRWPPPHDADVAAALAASPLVIMPRMTLTKEELKLAAAAVLSLAADAVDAARGAADALAALRETLLEVRDGVDELVVLARRAAATAGGGGGRRGRAARAAPRRRAASPPLGVRTRARSRRGQW
jgi:hypothetical protein